MAHIEQNVTKNTYRLTLLLGSLKAKDHMGGLGVDGRIIRKVVFET
jgi:hypothetical protein